MRIEIYKDGIKKAVKEDRLLRFLEQGWQTSAEPAPKKTSKPKLKIEATADVESLESLDPPSELDFQLPTNDYKGE